LMSDDLPTLGYPTIPTVRAEWGVERAYCFNRWSRAGAPREEEVVGRAGRTEGWPGTEEGCERGTAFWDRLPRCDWVDDLNGIQGNECRRYFSQFSSTARGTRSTRVRIELAHATPH
jgi:hypothetical protein